MRNREQKSIEKKSNINQKYTVNVWLTQCEALKVHIVCRVYYGDRLVCTLVFPYFIVLKHLCIRFIGSSGSSCSSSTTIAFIISQNSYLFLSEVKQFPVNAIHRQNDVPK